jgi:hypothetical protein
MAKMFSPAYDIGKVDTYLKEARTLASNDMAELQAYLALTPRGFWTSKSGGYEASKIDSFIGALDEVIAKCATELSRILLFPYSRSTRCI